MTAEEIEAAVDDAAPVPVAHKDSSEPVHYLGRTEVAYYLGLAGLPSLTGVELPPPDVMIGDRKGWSPKTIDEWNAKRPGKGRWGARL